MLTAKRSLNMACLMPLVASAKRVGVSFNNSTMWFCDSFSFVPSFKGKTQTFAVVYFVFHVNFAPPICSPLPGPPMRDGCPKGRTSRVPTLQQLGYLETPIFGVLGGGCLVGFFGDGWGKSTQKNGGVGERHYRKSIFFMFEEARFLLFAMQTSKKHPVGEEETLYDIWFLICNLCVERFLVSKFFNQSHGWRILHH